jgi:hypothetical protein
VGRIAESFIGFVFFVITGFVTMGLLYVYKTFQVFEKTEQMYGFLMALLVFLIVYLMLIFLVSVVAKGFAVRGVRLGA